MIPVSVADLRLELSRSGDDIVDEVSFEINAGEVLGLVGESGSGKTSTALALLGDVRSGVRMAGGRVMIDGEDVFASNPEPLRGLRGRTISYIPQDPLSALNPALPIGQQVNELFEFHESACPPSEAEDRLRSTLTEVRLPADDAFLKRFPHQLSGGQLQRVGIAMAFVLRPKVIVLDEPTTGLDVTTQAQLLRTIRDLCASYQVAALYVTHDLAVVANLAHRILVMYAGRVVESGPCAQVFEHPVHPYTRRLIGAVPTISRRHPLVGIKGHAPGPSSRPSGCPFHPRCPDAIPSCTTKMPPTEDLGDRHRVRCLRANETRLEPNPAAAIAPNLRPPEDRAPLLKVTGVSAFHGSRQILAGIDLEVLPQECVALVGESGSGKTTLSRCIVGLHRSMEGSMEFRGEQLELNCRKRPRGQRQAMQYIFQNPYSSLNPRHSVADILATPLRLFFGIGGSEANARIADVLERVSLPPAAAERYPSELSGGERQRVAIARALACEPEVLICDEITSALDVSVQAAIAKLLLQLKQEDGLALLFVTHNLALVRNIADRVLTLKDGHLVESGPTTAVLDHPQDPYTKRLIADTPRMPLEVASHG